MRLRNLLWANRGTFARHSTQGEMPSLSLPRLYCARCGLRLRFNVVERGERLGIEPTETRCPRCGALLLDDDATVEIEPHKAR